MSKISDELREFVEENDLYASQIAKLNTIADRIDAELVELPKDAHGEYIVRQNVECENAKLRELVADMYKAFMHGNCYRWCEFKEPCNYITDGKCQWYDRMRELGVDA